MDLSELKAELTGMDIEDPTIPSQGQPLSDYSYERRLIGADYPQTALTMVGRLRLDNLQECIETGVWRGGSCIFMRAVLAELGVTDRTVWVADSFQGMPHDPVFSSHEIAELRIPLDTVKANFERYGLLDDQVRFLPGWFNDTLPSAPIEKLAILRLDGDLYDSTMDALVSLYPKLQPGGFCIVDDYFIHVCQAAVHEYRGSNDITEVIQPIDYFSRFWRRS
jgi:hypothetical protein